MPTPVVLRFFRIWCALFVALYAAMAGYELLVARGVIEPDLGLIELVLADHDPAVRAQLLAEKRSDAIGGMVIALMAVGFYSFCTTVPRRRWMWVLGIVAAATTVFPFIITAAGTVPLLLLWTKPRVKRYFQEIR